MEFDINKVSSTPKFHSSSFGSSKEKLNSDKAMRKVSFKAQKQTYQLEKQKAAQEFLNVLDDPSIIILSDWLKVRGSLKGWTKMYCVLKPGLLILYSSEKIDKHGRWIGTIVLPSCRLIERPSKKNGFCFKIFHPTGESIWTSKGPKGETIGAVTQPLPYSYLIFRAPSEEAGKCWMDAISLATKCSSLLLRSMTSTTSSNKTAGTSSGSYLSLSPTTAPGSKIGNNSSTCSVPSGGLNRRSSHLSEPGTSLLTPGYAPSRARSSDRISNCGLDEAPSTHRTVDGADDFDVDADDFGDDETDDDEEAEHDSSEPEPDDVSGGDKDRPLTNYSNPDTSGSVLQDGSNAPESYELEPNGPESIYLEQETEDLGTPGEAGQVEEVGEENKSLIWALVKQVKPGMDLSKVTLPTFILEPRSFLDKLTDYYYHSDILAQAQSVDDPFTRMKIVIKWYLSGFYKKPRGLKKPYNSVLGEVFRCLWRHPQTTSRTFYIAEQVSHHPPVSAFYVTNRKDGFAVSGTILTRSKFYGNSISAILDGYGRVTFLSRGEDYLVSMPYAHCKGILVGTLTMELGGKVSIECAKTGYCTLLEFKLKPMFGSAESANLITGRIKLGEETLAKLDGHWDGQIHIKDNRTGKKELFWDALCPTTLESRLKRSVIPLDQQQGNESEKLWLGLSEALIAGDQEKATQEKTAVEDRQRERVKELKTENKAWNPVLFTYHTPTGEWLYKYGDMRPWDPLNDLHQFERDFVIQTKTIHKTSISFQSGRQYKTLDQGSAGKRMSLHHTTDNSGGQFQDALGMAPEGYSAQHSNDDDDQAFHSPTNPNPADRSTMLDDERDSDKFRHLFESMQAIQAENAKILKNLHERLKESGNSVIYSSPLDGVSQRSAPKSGSSLAWSRQYTPSSDQSCLRNIFATNFGGMKELLLVTIIFLLSQIFVAWIFK